MLAIGGVFSLLAFKEFLWPAAGAVELEKDYVDELARRELDRVGITARVRTAQDWLKETEPWTPELLAELTALN